MGPEVERRNRSARERATPKDVVLSLIVVVCDLVLIERFLEVDDVRALLLDQDLDLRVVQRFSVNV
jgi:hypothetical protein